MFNTLKGFSPVCTLICRINWLGFWKVFKHMVHLYIVLCFVPLLVCFTIFVCSYKEINTIRLPGTDTICLLEALPKK